MKCLVNVYQLFVSVFFFTYFRYRNPENPFYFFKSSYLGYFRCIRDTTRTFLVSNGEPVPVESEIVRVVSLNTTKISEITRLKYSLNIFILHRLRNKFLQLILISLNSASWELHQYSRRMCGPMKNPKVETRSRGSNSGPHDCDALHHDHGHHN